MSSVDQNALDIAALKARLDSIDSEKKKGNKLNAASSIDSGNKVLILQTDELKTYDANALLPTKWMQIDDAWVCKGSGKTDRETIEATDIIKRFPTTSRYIHARVESLPYTDDSNLKFFEDISII